MPGVPPAVTPPYDTAEYVLKLARARCNDAGLTADGNLLSDSQPYTFIYVNSAIRDVQQSLANNGVETFPNEVVISDIPICATTDPAIYCWLGYDNFFDGVSKLTSPLLPQDLLIPTVLGERQSGSLSVMIPMFPVNDGLPSRPKTSWLREWEWRDDRIYLVGSLQQTDLRLRYSRVIPDVNAPDNPIPLMRCASLLAWHIAYEFALGRGGDVASTFQGLYQNELAEVILRTTRKTQRNNNRRIPYGGQQSGFPNWGWSW